MSDGKLPDVLESGGPHAGAVAPLVVGPTPDHRHDGGSRWAAIQTASDFLSTPEAEADVLEPRVLARGSLTEFISPRGLGKTHVAHATAVRQASMGMRVLIIDRDNSRRELRRRLRGWGADGLTTLHVLGRDDAPPLTDRRAWSEFPSNYDLVVIDSLDSSTEGVGEQDSAKPSMAMAPLLDIVHKAAGPAVLVLGNTVKSGTHGRGSGVIEDRADIVFEVRDATDFRPSGTKDWWLELPSADRGSWADRATRRRKRDTYRLAFVPSKFRVGEEPEPFVLEIRLGTEPWECHDVTADIVTAGEQAVAQVAHERAERVQQATRALREEVANRAREGAALRRRQDAEPFLTDRGMSRRKARVLIAEGNGRDWRIAGGARKGDPEVLLPLADVDSEVIAAGIHDGPEPRQMRLEENAIPAAQEASEPPELNLTDSASDAAEIEPPFPPPVSPKGPEVDRVTCDGDDVCPGCGGRVLRWGFGDVCSSCHRRVAHPDGPVAPVDGAGEVEQGSVGS